MTGLRLPFVEEGTKGLGPFVPTVDEDCVVCLTGFREVGPVDRLARQSFRSEYPWCGPTHVPSRDASGVTEVEPSHGEGKGSGYSEGYFLGLRLETFVLGRLQMTFGGLLDRKSRRDNMSSTPELKSLDT